MPARAGAEEIRGSAAVTHRLRTSRRNDDAFTSASSPGGSGREVLPLDLGRYPGDGVVGRAAMSGSTYTGAFGSKKPLFGVLEALMR
jgi:hypothetical protein